MDASPCPYVLKHFCSYVLMSLCFSALAANLIEHHNIPTSSPIQFGLIQKRCKGLVKALPPSKEVCNLHTNICPHAVCLLINECVCFYCHLTLFARNKLIYRGFKSVRWFQSILHTPCIHLTHLTPLPRVLFGRMKWVLRHRDVEKFVGATDFSVPLCCNIALPWACRVAACELCRWRVGCVGYV